MSHRILVLDGNADHAKTLTAWLASEGRQVIPATSPAQAVSEIETCLPDLVVLGSCPRGNGSRPFFEQLSALQADRNVPVLLLAREGRESDVTEGVFYPDDVLLGPLSMPQVTARVRSLLKTKALADRLRLAYFHLDELSGFTETYADQIVADWRPEDLAARMASVLLSPREGTPQRPSFIWGSAVIRGRRHGIACYRTNGDWHSLVTRCPSGELEKLLRPYAIAPGRFICNAPLPGRLKAVLGVSPELSLPNFAAIFREDDALLAAGYPWEVTIHDLPLLQASLRQWSVFRRIWREARKTEEANFQAMEALALAAEFHDSTTAGHVRRLNTYARNLSRLLGQSSRFVRWISHCAQLHDVGKLTLPGSLLNKRGPLDPGEWERVRAHTVNGARLLGHSPQLAMAARIARHHHENFDGTGYPDGLAAERIPLEARIVKLADVYDALRTERPYKKGYSHQEALEVLAKGDGRVLPVHFDPSVLEAFLSSHRDFEAVFDGDRTGAAS
ncbi:MAG: HD domain-containing phosphohydrolase [Acidobacteriota bacterium]